MITPATRERFLREEKGFTLVEMMITTLIMIVVLYALYNIFDMSVRVFSFGNNKVEAVESARVGMEKMEREIRAAYPVNNDDPNTYLFFDANGNTNISPSPAPPAAMPTATQITFGNNLGAPVGEPGGADGVITCGSPCEYITYKLTDDASNTECTVAPCSLRRVNAADSAGWGDPVVENVIPNDADPSTPNGLTFTYLKSDGNPVTSGNQGDISMVLITLNVQVNKGVFRSGTQSLTTVVDLRNR